MARGSLGSLGIRLGTVGLAFVSQMLLARLMGAEQYGLYTYALTAVNLLALVARLGTDGLFTRFGPAYVARAEWGLLRGLRRFGYRLVGLGTLLLALLAGLGLWLSRADHPAAHELALVLLPGSVMMGLSQSFLIGLKRPWQAQLPEPLSRLLLLVSAVSTYLWLGGLSAVWVMALGAAATLLGALLGGFWLRRAMPAAIGTAAPVFAIREWMGMALPMWVMSILRLLLGQSDILLIGWLLDETAAGIYAIASRLAELTTFGLQAVNTTLAPTIAERHATRRLGELQASLTRAARGILAFTLAVGVGLALLGEQLLHLFGPEFGAAMPPLLILLAGQTINAATGPAGTLLNMTGHQRVSSRLLGFCTGLTLVLHLLLIPRQGILGAATASAFGLSLLNLSLWGYARFTLKLNTTAFRRLSHGQA